MAKPTGFIELPRESPPKRDPSERVRDFREFILPEPPEQTRRQATRCMDCGVPFCHQGCPLGNPIPDFNGHLADGRWEAAYRALATTNDFPEFTGRLCPAPCEAACVLAIDQPAVTIENIEKALIERAFAEGWVRPEPPTHRSGKHVAVVGSGPAGLAAASQLNRAGHTVTVYERQDRLGGLLRYGIPDFKLEKHVIDRRLQLLLAEGVQFQTGAHVGSAPTWSALRASHDAVLLALGAEAPRRLEVPGHDLPGVVLAMDFLERQNRLCAGDPEVDLDKSARGRHVLILGGGDTGSDCLGTAHRQGAASVTQIELLPAPSEARSPGNPWPQWPMVFRTSSSQDEGGVREFALRTERVVAGADGRVAAIEAVGVRLTASGGLEDAPEHRVTLPCDLLVLAMGFVGPRHAAALSTGLGVALDRRGNVATDGRFQTSVPGVFAAGDGQRGASLIVWAISDGRECARAVDGWLTGAPSRLPTRGVHQAFGGR